MNAMKTKSGCLLATLMVSLGSGVGIQAASTIQFSAANYSVAENAGQATITVQRTLDLDPSVA